MVPGHFSYGMVKLYLFSEQFPPLKQGVILSSNNEEESTGDWEMNSAG